jgi:hypothetical protein
MPVRNRHAEPVSASGAKTRAAGAPMHRAQILIAAGQSVFNATTQRRNESGRVPNAMRFLHHPRSDSYCFGIVVRSAVFEKRPTGEGVVASLR